MWITVEICFAVSISNVCYFKKDVLYQDFIAVLLLCQDMKHQNSLSKRKETVSYWWWVEFTIKDYDIISGSIRINGSIQNFYKPF